MVNFSQLKVDLKNNVFLRSDLKKTAEIIHYVVTKSDFNEDVFQFSNQEAIEGIAIRSVPLRRKFDRFGIYSDSSLVYLIPYDTEVTLADKIYIYDDYYDVIGIDSWTGGQEESLGQKVFLRKSKVILPTIVPTQLVNWTTDLGIDMTTDLGEILEFKIPA